MFESDPDACGIVEFLYGVDHDDGGQRRGGHRHLARRGLDKVGTSEDGQFAGFADVLDGFQLARLKDDFQSSLISTGFLDGLDLVEDLVVATSEECVLFFH